MDNKKSVNELIIEANAFLFGIKLAQYFKDMGEHRIPDLEKAADCFEEGLTVEQTADLIIDQNWWTNGQQTNT